MPVKIEGVNYVSSTEVLDEFDISRQTLWRWRTQGKIPAGHKFRDGRILFSDSELEEIRRFATHLEPLDQLVNNQLDLFGG